MTPATIALIAAALAQGAIALVLLFMLGAIRVPMVTSGKMPVAKVALSREPWPEHEKKVANAFDNQFQLPVLFYVAIGLTLYFGATWIEVVLAWLFVVSRVDPRRDLRDAQPRLSTVLRLHLRLRSARHLLARSDRAAGRRRGAGALRCGCPDGSRPRSRFSPTSTRVTGRLRKR